MNFIQDRLQKIPKNHQELESMETGKLEPSFPQGVAIILGLKEGTWRSPCAISQPTCW